MTREEAIKVLKYQRGYFCDFKGCPEQQAFTMAINALEQEPFINKPCVSNGVCEHDKNKVFDKIMAEIEDEADYAYADFDKYKEDILHADPDELPDDDFRYGLRRAVEIINKYKAESRTEQTLAYADQDTLMSAT